MMLTINYAFHLTVTLWLALQDAEVNQSFDDIGTLFLGGILGAVCLAVVIVFIRLKMQSGRDATASYISIKAPAHDGKD